jgi:lipopolysaccharide heptosyltransferase II
MHVLQLLPALEVGGVERGVIDLAKGLRSRGHQVSVVSSGGALVDRLNQLGVPHHQLPVHEKSLATMRACIPAVADLIRRAGIDVVHARSRVPAWIGYAAARQTQRPFITTAHGFYQSRWGSQVMGWGRTVIVPSEALAHYLVTRLGISRQRLQVIPRGIDLEEFMFQPRAAREGAWRVGLIGRGSVLKGHDVALQAFARLMQQGHEIRLCFAGEAPGTPARQRLEAQVRALRLEGRVEWLGIQQDIPAVLATLDCLIMPSTYPESFGRSALEAQAVGRPVVASRIGALAEVIEDGVTGLLVPPRDPHALAQALVRLKEDPTLCQRLVQAGRRRVESQWDAQRMVAQTLDVYQDALTKPRIIIWKLSALGDVVLSVPTLRAVRKQYPQAQITLAVGRAAYEVVARCPYLDGVLLYEPRRHGSWWGLRRFVRRVQEERFDLSIDLQNSRKTHAMAWLAGIPVRIGYRRKFAGLLNRGVRLPRVQLAPIAHQQHLLQQAGIGTDGEALELWPSTQDVQRAQSLVPPVDQRAGGMLVGMHPGGSGRWQTKRWDIERWAQLGQLLQQRGVTVVVTGGPEERPLGEALRRLTARAPVMLIGQTSLMELACVIRQCDVFVAHDSSSLHLAAAMGTPTIALFGPTDPRRHLPPLFKGQVIQYPVFCSPCYSPHCRTITHACMKKISVEEVHQAVANWLAEAEQRPLAPPVG